MKKKHILTSIALSLLLSFMLLSCNADATAGLFRQISNASAPVGIVYKQIVGLDTTAPKTLYFLTDEGLYKKSDGSSSTKLVANEEGEIIQTAYFESPTTIVYQINELGDDGYKIIRTTDVLGTAGTTYNFSEFDYVKLLPNGLVLTKDTTTSTFKLFNYNVPASEIASTGKVSGYDLVSVLQLTGKEHMTVSATNPLLISLTNGSDYRHFYYDGGATVTELNTSTKNLRFVSMAFINAKIYLLTDDGNLHAATAADATTFNLMHDTNESYKEYVFMYATSDGTTTRLITKPDGINKPLYVISFLVNTVTNTASITSTTIRDGYGKYLDAAEIVDSYEKDAGNLLVATSNNGMFEINLATNTSSSAENYTLD
jgi:hypothetical protein